MTKRERLFFMLWGLILFPLLIIWVTVKFTMGAGVLISLLAYMGCVKFLLTKDADCPGGSNGT